MNLHDAGVYRYSKWRYWLEGSEYLGHFILGKYAILYGYIIIPISNHKEISLTFRFPFCLRSKTPNLSDPRAFSATAKLLAAHSASFRTEESVVVQARRKAWRGWGGTNSYGEKKMVKKHRENSVESDKFGRGWWLSLLLDFQPNRTQWNKVKTPALSKTLRVSWGWVCLVFGVWTLRVCAKKKPYKSIWHPVQEGPGTNMNLRFKHVFWKTQVVLFR